jgi:hypothetical protein
MRVGVLTLPLHVNYGGILQAFAMMRVLRELGHEVVLIDRRVDYSRSYKYVVTLLFRVMRQRRLKKSGLDVFREIRSECERKLHGREIAEFVRREIQPVTSPCVSSAALRRTIREDRLDAVVVGSDQVWRASYAPNLFDYFLVPTAGLRLRRIAYAASFGVEHPKFGSLKTRVLKSALKAFDFVGVRESAGVQTCARLFDVQATHVLDPTMLLRAEDYEATISRSPSPVPVDRLLVYVLDRTKHLDALVERVAAQTGLKPHYVTANMGAWGDMHERFRAPSVEDWLKDLKLARMVITDSFHACVFSILFQTPFLALGNKARGLSRFESLLDNFGLRDRLLIDDSVPPDGNLLEGIDWKRVGERVASERARSIGLLNRALQ